MRRSLLFLFSIGEFFRLQSSHAQSLSLSFDSLPSSQDWFYQGTALDSTVYSATGTTLTLNTLAVTGDDTSVYFLANPFDPNAPFTIELIARIIEAGPSGFFGISVWNGTERFQVALGANWIRSQDSLFGFDTSVFHNVRLEVTPTQGSELFIDNSPIASFGVLPATIPSQILFGDGSLSPGSDVFAEISHLSITSLTDPQDGDRDGDGVLDPEDQCPDRPGPAILNGCPDTDLDGIPDQFDDCPVVPGAAAHNGCPPPPLLTCPQPNAVKGCDLTDIGSLPYSEVPVRISLEQLRSEGGEAFSDCGIASINYFDTRAGECPEFTVIRTFTVVDGCGVEVSCRQSISFIRKNLIGSPPKDFAVIGLSYTVVPDGPKRWILLPKVRVKNTGSNVTPLTRVRFEIIGPVERSSSEGVPYLAPSQYVDIFGTRGVNGFSLRRGNYTVRAILDPNGNVIETDESNNRREIPVSIP